jgi:predicted RNase H-like HicB family nuclease
VSDSLIRIPLRVVFYQEGDFAVAHCLEFNLIGHGKTKDEAIQLLQEAIAVQLEASLEHGNIDNLLSPADKQFERMFYEGEDVAEGELQVSLVPIRREHIELEAASFRVYRKSCKQNLQTA